MEQYERMQQLRTARLSTYSIADLDPLSHPLHRSAGFVPEQKRENTPRPKPSMGSRAERHGRGSPGREGPGTGHCGHRSPRQVQNPGVDAGRWWVDVSGVSLGSRRSGHCFSFLVFTEAGGEAKRRGNTGRGD